MYKNKSRFLLSGSLLGVTTQTHSHGNMLMGLLIIPSPKYGIRPLDSFLTHVVTMSVIRVLKTSTYFNMLRTVPFIRVFSPCLSS